MTTGARSRNTTGPDRHSSSDLYNVRLEVYSFMFHILLLDANEISPPSLFPIRDQEEQLVYLEISFIYVLTCSST